MLKRRLMHTIRLLLLSIVIFPILVPSLYGQVDVGQNKRRKANNAIIHLSTRKSPIVGVLQEVGDSAVFLVVKRVTLTVPYHEIKKIVIKRKGRMGWTITTGILVGAAAGNIIAGTSDSEFSYCAECAFYGTILGAGVGATVGTLLGAIPKKKMVIRQSYEAYSESVPLLRQYAFKASK